MRPFDVVLIGEILVELYPGEPLTRKATSLRLGFSGRHMLDTTNRRPPPGRRAPTAVLTSIGDDELGGAILARAAALGINTSLIRRTSAPRPVPTCCTVTFPGKPSSPTGAPGVPPRR